MSAPWGEGEASWKQASLGERQNAIRCGLTLIDLLLKCRLSGGDWSGKAKSASRWFVLECDHASL
eukprot:scaffold189300_cov30-Tisochrysis_lutea.AAC.3